MPTAPNMAATGGRSLCIGPWPVKRHANRMPFAARKTLMKWWPLSTFVDSTTLRSPQAVGVAGFAEAQCQCLAESCSTPHNWPASCRLTRCPELSRYFQEHSAQTWKANSNPSTESLLGISRSRLILQLLAVGLPAVEPVNFLPATGKSKTWLWHWKLCWPMALSFAPVARQPQLQVATSLTSSLVVKEPLA